MSEIKEVFNRFKIVAPLTIESATGTFLVARGGFDSIELVIGRTERITHEFQEAESLGSLDIYRLMGKGVEYGIPPLGITTAITLVGCLLIADFFRRAESVREKYRNKND